MLGFPVFQYYQHLPHLAVVALERLTGGDPLLLLRLMNLLAVALFPLTTFVALRWLDVPVRVSALASLTAPLLSTAGLSGLDAGSYLWRGAGLYTQAWGMTLLPLTVAATHRAVHRGRRVTLAAAVLAGTLLSHLVYGWIAVLSAVVLTMVAARAGLPRRLERLALVLAGAAVAAAYFLVPYALNHAELNRSVWEPPFKYDSYGHAEVLRLLITGQILDAGRLPVLTVLLGAGVIAAVRARERWQLGVLALFVTWLLLFFGRPTWGPLLDLLPGARDLHFHRLIGAVHLAAIPLIGLGLDALVRAIGKLRPPWLAGAAATVAVALVLAPAVVERARYAGENQRLMRESATALAAGAADIAAVHALLDRLEARAPARVYAGLPGTWGGRFTVGHVPMYALLSLHGLPTLGYAYHAMSRTADVMYHFDDSRADHYEIFNVGYVVAPGGRAVPSFLEPVATLGAFSVYRARPAGYVSVIAAADALPAEAAARYRASVAWLATPPPSREPGRVVAERLERQGWSATLSATRAGHALVKTTYHPWWRAEVDGVATPTLAVAPGFLAIPIAAGEHRLRVTYRPPAWKTVLAVLGPLALGVLYFHERRRPVQ